MIILLLEPDQLSYLFPGEIHSLRGHEAGDEAVVNWIDQVRVPGVHGAYGPVILTVAKSPGFGALTVWPGPSDIL